MLRGKFCRFAAQTHSGSPLMRLRLCFAVHMTRRFFMSVHVGTPSIGIGCASRMAMHVPTSYPLATFTFRLANDGNDDAFVGILLEIIGWGAPGAVSRGKMRHLPPHSDSQ